MKMTKWIAAATLFIFTLPVSAQIPVTDAAHISVDVANQVETIAKWAQQYTQMTQQINQLQAQYNSMTGSRGLGNIFNNPSLRDYLPTNWQGVYDSVKGGGYSGLTGSAQALYNSNKLFDACAHIVQTDQRLACEARAVKPSQDQSFALDAYAKARSRINQLDSLMSEIDSTSDPKAIAELQARINAEQANIQNEQTKLQLYAMVAEAEEKVQAQRQKELNAKANSRRGWVSPSSVSF